jgi:serine/threonine-protein kinase
VGALDDWASCATDKGKLQRLFAVARAADPDRWRDRVRDLRHWSSDDELEALLRNADVSTQSITLMLILTDVVSERGRNVLPFYRKLQAAHPGDFWVNFKLAELLDSRNDPDSIGFYRAALAAQSDAVAALVNLGIALARSHRDEEAMECWLSALHLAPQSPLVHNTLATAGLHMGDLDFAIEHSTAAIAVSPDLGVAHGVLARALVARAQYDDAAPHIKRALELLPERHPHRALVEETKALLEHGEEMASKADQVADRTLVVADGPETLEFAEILRLRGQFAVSVRLYEEAFRLAPALAENPLSGNRFDAACAAVQTCALEREDGKKTALSDQALQWIREDLAAWNRRLESGNAPLRASAVRALKRWRTESQLAAVRDAAAVSGLSATTEDGWRALWRDVDAALEHAATRGD